MKHMHSKRKTALALAFAGMLAIGPAMADKPSSGGKGKGGGNDSAQHSDNRGGDRRDHFDDQQRIHVRDYYDGQYAQGRCPPGLAKKHNGCLPPGQAKKWQMGQQLPRDVVYYTVPQPLLAQFGTPPVGYRYVRVGSDILLMSTTTRTIIDAILNLGRG